MTSAFQFGAFQESAWQTSAAGAPADAFQADAFQNDAYQTSLYDDAFQRCAFQDTGFQTSACPKPDVVRPGGRGRRRAVFEWPIREQTAQQKTISISELHQEDIVVTDLLLALTTKGFFNGRIQA